MYKEYPKFLAYEILVYLRKSRSDDPMLSVEEVLAKHEQILREWAEKNLDEPIPEENFYREVVSGETINSRPEFKKLLKQIESQKIKAVLIVECARLGRPDLEEIGRISKLFRYTGTHIITPQRIFDLKDEYDREQFERELMRGNDYLEYSKKILRRGKEISLKSGYYVNAVPPYGYEREWIMEGKRKRPSLAIVEDEAKVVRMIFDMYVNEGIGATKICQKLNAMGIKPRKGDTWKKSSVINMLKNEHYIGKVVIRKHVKVNSVVDQEIITKSLFNEEFETVDGKHPAIIDEVLFHKANTKVSRYPSTKPSETLQNPYAGILKCNCGKCMIRRPSRGTIRYLCDEQAICGNSSISEKELTKGIIKGLKVKLKDLMENVSDDDNRKKQKHQDKISMLEAKCVELERKEISLWEKYTEEKMPKHIFDNLIEKCMEEKKTAENALKMAYNDMPTQIDYGEAVVTLHQAIEALSNESVSASTKNKLLSAVCDKITYHRERPIRQIDGKNTTNGWKTTNFELDIDLKL